jgi:lactoylglutathione lyase
MDMVKLGYAILYVANVQQAMAFYESTFDFKRKFITPENDYGELITGETTLSFASVSLASSNIKSGFIESTLTQKPFGIEIGMVTDNVALLLEKAIQQGATIVTEAMQKPWGQTVAYIRDLDGFLIELCTPMG